MVTYMNDKKIQSLDDVRTFLAGTLEMEFSIPDKAARYRWIEQTLRRFRYRTLGRPERGVILRYVERVSGYSRPTVTRLVAQYGAQGTLQRRHRTVAGFVRYYSDADTRLLAELDELHGTPCGAAAKKLCERMCRIHGDLRYAALSHISVSHLYNLRKAKGYQRQRRRFDKTRPSRSTIAVRRQPEPQGKPGYLRLDTVHQGDLDGIKGLYHINAVDCVTQWQVVASVQAISEAHLLSVIEQMLEQFPFEILGFHADNGSEYVNHKVARLLDKLRIEFTRSRPRHSNDNALAETKNGAVVRKVFGYEHIPRRHAARFDTFCREYLNPFLNFHRPCLFATELADPKKPGRIKRVYRSRDAMTPLDKLASLSAAASFLRPGVTLLELHQLAHALTDVQAAEELNEARQTLFRRAATRTG